MPIWQTFQTYHAHVNLMRTDPNFCLGPRQIIRAPRFWADAEVTISIGIEAPSHTIIQTHQEVVEPGKKWENLWGSCCDL